MRKILTSSTAVLAAMAMLATPMMAAAQTAQPSPAPIAPPAAAANPAAPAAPGAGLAPSPAPLTAPAGDAAQAPAGELPAALAELGLTDATVSDNKHGKRVRGTLPGGETVVAGLDRDGELRMLRSAEKGAALPANVVERLVPQAVRDSAVFGEIVTVSAIMVARQGVMVGGQDAAGQAVRAGFSADGTLQRFGRGDMGKDGKHHGKKGERRGDDRRGDRQGDERRGDERRAPALDEAAARAALERGGYTEPGAMRQDGPRSLIDAVNSAGEQVTVEVNRRGEVVRETAR